MTSDIGDAAVAKWANIAARRERDKGSANCTLCKEFCYGTDDEDSEYMCPDYDGNPCPIEQQEFPGCIESPYDEWHTHVRCHEEHGIVQCRDCQVLALIEMLFVYDCVMGIKPKWNTEDIGFWIDFSDRLTFKDIGDDKIV